MNETDNQQRRSFWLGAVIIAFATFVAYLPALHGGFVWDDTVSLSENPLIPRRDGLYYFWFTSAPYDYFPLTFTSFWLEWRLWGSHAAGYHFTNVLLHACSALLLWRVLARLRIPGAWLAALIFALHPVAAASVTWIAERKNTLAMVFYLASALLYLEGERKKGKAEGRGQRTEERGQRAEVRGQRTEGGGRLSPGPNLCYVLSLFAFLLALLSKTSVVVLPLVLLLALWWKRSGEALPISRPFAVGLRDFARLLPFFLVAFVLGLITVWFQAHRATGAGTIVQSENLWQRAAAAGWALWFYLYKILLPIRLAAIYPRWDLSAAPVWAYLPLVGFICVLLLAWRFRKSWGRHVVFALGYFVLTLLPVLGFVDMFYLTYSRVADHWAYLALPGIIALVVAAAATLSAKMSLGAKESSASVSRATALPSGQLEFGPGNFAGDWKLAVGVFLLMGVLGFLTYERARVFSTEFNLWSDAARKNPSSPPVQNNLGLALLKANRVAEARHALEEALRLKPEFLEALSNMGFLLDRSGQHAEATGYYEKAVATNPRFATALNNLGVNLIELGKTNEGVAKFLAALSVNPNYAPSHENLAAHLLKLGTPDEALPHALQALELDRENPEAYYIAGNCWFLRGDLREAVENYATACRLRPDHAAARHNLAVALNKLGRTSEAAGHFSQAAALRPNDPNLKLQQGIILAQSGQLDEATEQFRSAVRLRPQDAEGHNRLGFILAKQGKFDAAMAEFKEALRLEPGNADAHKNLANALREAARLQQALPEMQEATRLQPTNGTIRAHFGALLAALGRDADATAQFHEALRFEPENVTAHFGLGNHYVQQGELAAASEHYLAALKSRPDFPEAQYQLALIAAARHDFKEGRRLLELAVQGKPDWPEALNNLAWLLATQNDPAVRNGAEAVKLAERAVELRKGQDAEQLDTLAAAYAESGRFEDAIKTAQRGIQGAKAAGQTNLVATIASRLRLYQSKQPYRE
jgi:tetratricopeptide (TPR) repeat protein